MLDKMWARSTRAYFDAGLCPCCGSELQEWYPLKSETPVQPAPVAEGVMFCGRCIGNEHHSRPEEGTLRMILEALASR